MPLFTTKYVIGVSVALFAFRILNLNVGLPRFTNYKDSDVSNQHSSNGRFKRPITVHAKFCHNLKFCKHIGKQAL
mgnify:FL=1